VDPGIKRCIRVIADQNKTFGTDRYPRPSKRRRDVFPLAGANRRDLEPGTNGEFLARSLSLIICTFKKRD
jgi:hypothetical protein